MSGSYQSPRKAQCIQIVDSNRKVIYTVYKMNRIVGVDGIDGLLNTSVRIFPFDFDYT